MRVAIIGGGFTGLAAAIELVDNGVEVSVFESEDKLGGLAVGFKDQGWEWSLEHFYHHIFANDSEVIELARKVGLPAVFSVPETNSFIGGVEKRLDSPSSLLTFSDLSIFSRLQMGIGLLILKLIPNGLFLENKKATEVLPKLLGEEGYRKVWGPLLSAKFGPYLNQVNLAWFWARIYKRTKSLGYFPGGFQALADKMGEYVIAKGGKISLGHKIKGISHDKDDKWWINDKKFDRVLLTSPAPTIDRLVENVSVNWPKINYLWAQTVILELEQSLMKGYWLNILDKNFPFLVVVEHTNFVDKKHYGNKIIIYLGNYLSDGDKRLKMDEERLIKFYTPYLKKINPRFEVSWIRKSWLFENPYAQPVFPINYSKEIPKMKTDPPGLYVANMSMVYPWDRGTNYAVASGQAVAKLIRNEE